MVRVSVPPVALPVATMAVGDGAAAASANSACTVVGKVVASAVALAVVSSASEARGVRGPGLGDAADRCLDRVHGRLVPSL